jgi:hypothetical protein
MKIQNIIAIGVCYLLGLLISLSGALYILMHAGGHGGGKAMWYDQLLSPGIYIAAIFPPDTAYLAILLYTFVIGSVAYIPLKIIFKW